MSKYRIVEVVTPKLSVNEGGIIGFVPVVEYHTTYDIEVCGRLFWGLLELWAKTNYTFPSVERAEKQIEVMLSNVTQTVIKTY